MIASTLSTHSVREWIPTNPSPPTGHESPAEARDNGWLGQVPPPSTPTHSESCPSRQASAPTYANPQLAPEPWKADPLLPGTDPTLFG